MALVHEELVELLHDVNRSMGKYAREVLFQHDLPFSMLIISKHIRLEPGITISELARRTGIAKSHISNLIRELEQRGWVEKKSDASDQRILRLYLSQPASADIQLLGKRIRQQFNDLLADIPDQRAMQLIEDLTEIKAALDKNRGNCTPSQSCKLQEMKADD